MNDYNEGNKTRMKAERYEMKPLFNGVFECQKWVENANQPQLKPIIWYTSWYFLWVKLLFFILLKINSAFSQIFGRWKPWKVWNEAFIWWSLWMPEMSGKCKSNPTKTSILIYIMIFFWGGGKKISNFKISPPPLQNPYLRPCLMIRFP